METKIVLIVLIVVILVILARCVRVVQQSKAYVIERLGAFHTVWSVGLHFKVPFIDRVLRVVSLKEQVADFPPQPVITKDNVTMQIDTVLYYQITDPKLFAYGVENPMNAIENLTATTLRNIIGELELDHDLVGHIQILDLFGWSDAGYGTDILCARTSNTINSRQANDNVLMVGNINPCNTCHSFCPKLTLINLVFVYAWGFRKLP